MSKTNPSWARFQIAVVVTDAIAVAATAIACIAAVATRTEAVAA